MARSTVSPDIKAAALADLASGEQPAVVAERYSLGRNTVKSWAQRLKLQVPSLDAPLASTGATGATVSPQRSALEQQQHQIGVAVLDLLYAKLKASEAIAQVAHNPEWRARQTGTELAAFGTWLDQTAFAIGDRLAQSAARLESTADDATLPD